MTESDKATMVNRLTADARANQQEAAESAAAQQAQHDMGREAGLRWAVETATLDDLDKLAMRHAQKSDRFGRPYRNYPGLLYRVTTGDRKAGTTFAAAFINAALTAWFEVQPEADELTRPTAL